MHTSKRLSELLLIALLFSIGMAQAQPPPADTFKQAFIPAGPFPFGCSAKARLCAPDEGQPGGVMIDVPGFYLDIQETSVAEYRHCVETGACETPFDYLRTHYCNYGAPGRDNYPVNCVNWKMALQYCHWRGARLAYEIEWEKAARAGTVTPYY